MTITIGNPEIRPALTFDRIFLRSFVLQQDPVTRVRRLEAIVRAFALDADGAPVYSAQEHVLSFDDFDAWLLPAMAETLGSAEAVDAAYAAGKVAANTMNLLDCMAAFQAGVARLCEARGVFQVQAVA